MAGKKIPCKDFIGFGRELAAKSNIWGDFSVFLLGCFFPSQEILAQSWSSTLTYYFFTSREGRKEENADL